MSEALQAHLLLIDGLNVARRVYEANPAPESPEKIEGAVRSTKSSLYRALVEHSPTHLMLAVDAPGPTWRHALNPDYKKGRKPMPELLRAGLATLWDELRSKGWLVLEPPGYEADDVLASATAVAGACGVPCTVLSTDKDLVYLLSLGARVYDHFGRIDRNEAWCLQKLGVKPEQVLDWLALKGDSVDNIIGIDKVGEKTAAKLLAEFGDLETVLLRAQEGAIPGKLGERLREGAGIARAARQLTALKTGCFKSSFNWDKLNRFELPPPR